MPSNAVIYTILFGCIAVTLFAGFMSRRSNK